jgi:hypothetical protein
MPDLNPRQFGLSGEDRVSVAEQVMENAGHVGRTWHVPAMRYDDPARTDAHREIHEHLDNILSQHGMPGRGVQVNPKDWDLREPGSGQAMADHMTNRIGLKGEHASDMVLLHEVAHLIHGPGTGHGPEYANTLHGLYRQHISPEAADTFASIMWPERGR